MRRGNGTQTWSIDRSFTTITKTNYVGKTNLCEDWFQAPRTPWQIATWEKEKDVKGSRCTCKWPTVFIECRYPADECPDRCLSECGSPEAKDIISVGKCYGPHL